MERAQVETALDQLLREVRRATRAEAGTIFLPEGRHLRFAVVQNDFLAERLGEPGMRRRLQTSTVPLDEHSLAGFVALTAEAVNVVNAYEMSQETDSRFNRQVDMRTGYVTCSVLAVPILESPGKVVGVLELLNALDENAAIVPFGPEDETTARQIAARMAALTTSA